MKETRFAAALSYRNGVDGAPRLTAKGRARLAEKIVAMAKEAGVPVKEDRDLAALLSLVDVGDEIPPELYRIVAELFAFLYRVNGKLK